MYGDIHLFAEEIDFRSRTIRDTRASSRKKSPPDDGAKDCHGHARGFLYLSVYRRVPNQAESGGRWAPPGVGHHARAGLGIRCSSETNLPECRCLILA